MPQQQVQLLPPSLQQQAALGALQAALQASSPLAASALAAGAPPGLPMLAPVQRPTLGRTPAVGGSSPCTLTATGSALLQLKQSPRLARVSAHACQSVNTAHVLRTLPAARSSVYLSV